MSQPVIQTSFHTGEWAPALNARVDLAKYHSAAALLRNFFVDYRGGASSRSGTKYCLQCYKSSTAVRLIPFQASFTVGYVLEFGDQYIRFFNNGAAVLEATFAITGATQANPCVLTVTGNNYAIGDWIFVQGVVGMTQLNNRYFQVLNVSGASVTIGKILDGSNVDATGYTAYTSGGTAARVYTLGSPFAAADLAKIKFAQNVNSLILCHPNYQPQVLTLISSNNWTIGAIVFGTTVAVPGGTGIATTLGTGTANYAYVVTAVDANGQESGTSSVITLASKLDLRTTAGTNSISWTAVPGAASYNVYKAEISLAGAVPAGSQFGFIGNCTGTTFIDSNINPDFTQEPPIPENPFLGAGVASATITTPGSYTTVPSVTFAASSGGSQATGQAVLGAISFTIVDSGTGHTVGQIVSLSTPAGSPIYCTVKVTAIGAGGSFVSGIIEWPGAIGSGSTPTNPLQNVGGTTLKLNITWGVVGITITSPGSGYTSPPAITFGAGTAAATAVLSTAGGNPATVSFFQQRMVLAAPPTAVQTFYMSQPGSYYNFNISNPIQASDAITGSIVAGQLNEIKSMLSVPTGLMVLTSRAAWLVNGGTSGVAITPIDVTANAHSYNGCSDVPPIVANFDILFVQSKGSIVRDLSFNFYAQIFTGTDISILSSHLFYGFTIDEWAWAEEPFKVVWAIRSDGTMLTLTFLKEQEIIGWAHSDTQGLFNSVATITETVSFGAIDAVYTVVQRTINSVTVQYVERFAERLLNGQAKNAWCVDAGLQYNGAPATTFSGAEHLAGATVTGLADGAVIPPFTMPVNGSFTLGAAASVVTVGLAFLPQLQTLALDVGEPTIQGKRKSISGVTVRCQETLGLSIGKSFSSSVPMKDLVIGNVGSMTNQIVTDLVTGDARTIIDPSWDVPGQYCIQQLNPLPATILGVIPEIQVGDTK